MNDVAYLRPADLDAARRELASDPAGEPIAGGTDLLQRLEERVQVPGRLVDLAPLEELEGIEVTNGEVRLGALVTLAEVVEHPALRKAFPALVEALEVTASPQVRNLATVGGNPLQKPRCLYFRDATTPCNKREPGSGCGAIGGRNRNTAILGTSEHCLAAHPSDFAVAMTALDATVETANGDGGRVLPFGELHRLPGTTPHLDTVLEPGELIRGYRLATSPLARHSHYLKVRDRGEFEWALCSAAVALELDHRGVVAEARVAVGGVATKPWRLPRVEAVLTDRAPEPAVIRAAAARAGEDAVPRGDNAFKATLLPRTVARALTELTERL
jgi:xanthine dehydrogenase YagS FAD-binding subunit